MTALGNVPCNGCRACCLHDMIPLMPERGDLIWTYEHQVIATGAGPTAVLQCGETGECIYFRLEHQQVQALAEKMRADGIRVNQALTVQGPTLEKLLKEASKLDADLLILGSHQHGALYRLWYGDIAIDATKQAPCALLVVPNPTLQRL